MNKSVEKLLNECRSRYKLRELKAAAAIILIGLAVSLSILAAVPFYPVPGFWLTLVLAIPAVTIIAAGFKYFRSLPSDNRLAHIIEKKYPEFKNYLITYIDLCKTSDKDRTKGLSGSLIDAMKARTEDLAATHQGGRAVNSSVYDGLARTAWVLVVIALFSSIIGWKNISNNLGRIYYKPYSGVLAGRLVVTPGDLTLERHGSANIEARAVSHEPAPLMLHYRYGGDRENVQALDSGSYRFSDITRNITYYITAGEKLKSPEYKISIGVQPEILAFEFSNKYPEYTRLPGESFKSDRGDLRVYKGTEVRLKIRSSKNLAEASITGSKNLVSGQFSVDGNNPDTAVYTSVIVNEETYKISLKDTDGLVNRNPLTYHISIINDNRPEIKIVKPGRDMDLNPEMLVPLEIEASDDFGLSKLTLFWNKVDSDDLRSMILPLPEGTPRTASVTYLWDLSYEDISPGETIQYYVSAWDNFPFPEPQEGRSEIFSIRLPTVAEIMARTVDQQEMSSRETEALLENQKDLRERSRLLREQISKNKSMSWENKKELEQIMNQQKNISSKAEAVNDALKQLTENMLKDSIFSARNVDKIEKIQKLLQEVLTEDMKRILEEMRKAAEQVDIEEIAKKLSEIEFDQTEFEKQLERTLEMLERAKLEQELEQLAQEAGELAFEEDLLKEETRESAEKNDENKPENSGESNSEESGEDNLNPDTAAPDENAEQAMNKKVDDLVKKQEEIAKKTDSFFDKLKEMSDRTAKKDIEELDSLDSLADDSIRESTSKPMKQAMDDLAQKEFQKAMDMEQQASDMLSAVSKQLQTMSSDMQAKTDQQISAGLQRILLELIQLSSQQEISLQSARDLGPIRSLVSKELFDEKTITLARLQSIFEDQTGVIVEELERLAALEPTISRQPFQTLNSMRNRYTTAITAFEERAYSRSLGPMEDSLSLNNQAVRELIELAEEVSNMQCSNPKPRPQSFLDILRQLTQKQKKMNQGMKQMGSRPKNSAMQEMINQMAFQQAQMQSAMQQLSEKAGKFEELKKALDSASEGMSQLEKEIKRGEFGERTEEKQRQIMARLLEAQQSLQQQGISEERRSEIPAAYDSPDSPDVKISDLTPDKDIRGNYSADKLQNYPAVYQNKIRRYLQSLGDYK